MSGLRARSIALPVPGAMVGGLALDPSGMFVWVSLTESREMLWRYFPDRDRFEPEPMGDVLRGCLYIHRSLTFADGGVMYAGATRILGGTLYRARTRTGPFSPQSFLSLLSTSRVFGRLATRTRILRRDPDGSWHRQSEESLFCIDLRWHAKSRTLFRLSPGGVATVPPAGGRAQWLTSSRGFVHALALGPSGELLSTTEDGALNLVEGGRTVRVGYLHDTVGPRKASPGIDGLTSCGGRYLVGGTRNLARPFVFDFESRKLHVLEPRPTAPRASAFCEARDGGALFAAGVGKVGLYAMDAKSLHVEDLGTVREKALECHHLHDLVPLPDGRLLGGEFFPLDVTDPPWPKRECRLWEINRQTV